MASPGAAHTREIAFPAPSGFPTAFDPLGRERGRKEAKDGDPGAPVLAYQYDQLGQLTNATRTPASVVLPNMQVTYDALGNLLTQTAGTGSSGARLSYQTVDRDRICSIAYGTGTPSTTCNVKYDSTGNIVEQPTRGNGKRTLSYFASGPVKQVTDTAGNDARFHYDAFGELQALELTSPTSPDTRHDERFGALVATRDELIGVARVPVMLRAIQTGGGIATRHGATPPAKWTFTFGESRGNRFVTDETGNFVQDVDYQAYGEPKSTGAQPGARSYTSAQWNGGDALVALGLSQLGARLYDPVIGRFLSRDPLLIPRTARTTNPYAFAINDPINEADPSGLERESTADEGDDPFEGWLTPNGEYDLSSWQNEYIYVSARGPAQEFSMSPFDVMLGIQGALHVSQPGAVGRAWNRMLDIDIALTRGAQRGVAQTVNAMIAPMRQVINDPWAAASKMSDPLFAARSLLDTVHGTGVFLGESAARIVSATSGEELAGVVAELGITVAVGIVMDRLMPGAPHAIPESPPPLRNIPANAQIRVLKPVKGGSQYGVEYVWKNGNNQTVRWRVHGPDLSAPPGSNSATGITYRVQVGKRYMDAQGNLFPKNVHEPASPNYDPAAANATHIPFPSGLFNWFH